VPPAAAEVPPVFEVVPPFGLPVAPPLAEEPPVGTAVAPPVAVEVPPVAPDVVLPPWLGAPPVAVADPPVAPTVAAGFEQANCEPAITNSHTMAPNLLGSTTFETRSNPDWRFI